MISGLSTICLRTTPIVVQQRTVFADRSVAISSGTIENRKMLSKQKISAIGAAALAPSIASARPGPI